MSPPTRVFSRVSLVLLLVGFVSGCGHADTRERPEVRGPDAAHADGPAMAFRVEGGGLEHASFLVGTVHLLRPSDRLHPAFFEALDASDTLCVEADVENANSLTLQAKVALSGMYPPGESLRPHLDDETRQAFVDACARAGLDPAVVERMRPWLAATTLEVAAFTDAGFQSEGGVDQQLLDAAKKSGHRIVELESAEEQLDIISGLPEGVQVRMLKDTLASTSEPDKLLTLIDAWAAGDVDALSAIALEGHDDPELLPLFDAMFKKRNHKMLKKTVALLNAGRRVLVAVGAAHLLGDDGLVALLLERGYTVTQIGSATKGAR